MNGMANNHNKSRTHSYYITYEVNIVLQNIRKLIIQNVNKQLAHVIKLIKNIHELRQ